MAIVISSLTPTNPTTPAGSGIVFNISAADDQGATLSYEWQYSTDGTNYSSSGLSNNTTSSFDTGPLTINQSGIYFRCVVSTSTETVNSNEYTGIGDRIVTVFQDPSILLFVDSTVDFYPTSQTKSVGQTYVLTVSATLQNADISNTTLVNNLSFQWQRTEDSGSTWINLNNGGNISITDTIDVIDSTTAYMKYSTLNISNLTFNDNQDQFRVRVSYTGALNTPVDTSATLLLIDPQINVIRQPGVDVNDTQITNCYKTSIPNSGEVRVSVSALTTAGTSLTYSWEVNFGDGEWYAIADITNFYVFALKPGTTSDTDLLELERFIYYEEPGFRCVISGTNGEATVTTTPHYIYMTDVEVPVVTETTSYDVVEDRYGDIPNRDTFVNDPIQRVIINASLDISENTGLNGNDTYTWQRQEPGSTTWVDLSDPAPIYLEESDSLSSYTQFPENLPEDLVELVLETPPLRIDTDDGAKYRVKVESTSLFTLNGNTKTLIPYYSSEITINVFRTIYIVNQPTDADVYPNYSTAFAVTASASSGLSSDITYQWQYNTSNSATGWVNIANVSPYSGATTDLLTIDSVPSNITYLYYRCVMSIPNQLASVTTRVAEITIQRDYFTSISSLNDVVVREFQNHTFSISAASVSSGPISYQWEKSTDYNTSTNTGTWTQISGETSNSLVLLSIQQSDDAFYRVRLTSSGGQILYSNVARLTFQAVNITILEDIPSSISVLEGESAAYTFECEGVASISTDVTYQWEIRRVGDSSFSTIGTGHNNSSDTSRIYVIRALDTTVDGGAIIRCKMSAADVPNDVYTTECTVTVVRRFTYFADVATKRITIGDTLTLDLNPSFTGGNPAYSWEENGVAMGETGDTLVIPNITSAYDGRTYRCNITLDSCTEHRYSRNNTVTTVTISPPSEYTVSITLSTVTAPSVPTYYSNETAKTGAAVGTVICIPKPAGYVEDPSASDDDIGQWKCSRAGTAGNTTAVSIETSGSIWSANKPSWATSYTSPKWLLDEDRFKGYIEMRGQYVKALDFPELARQWGTKFGGSISGTYPNYNSADYFRLPNTYAKRMMGTGNVNNNSGSTSVVPLYNPDGSSGGDKNVAGSMGGVYNYERSAQLPPGSPGVSGQPDGTADGSVNAATFSIGSYQTAGMDEVSAFVQPSFSGTVTYNVGNPGESFTDLPTHNHTAVSAGWRETSGISSNDCFGSYGTLNPGGEFRFTSAEGGTLSTSTTTLSQAHGHTTDDIGPGSFNMVQDAGMGISDTTLRFTGANSSIMNNNLSFFLRNNEQIPVNAPYFRLKYMIKAY